MDRRHIQNVPRRDYEYPWSFKVGQKKKTQNPEYKYPCKLPDQVYEQLQCSKCENYLSVGPIMWSEEGDICGRCCGNSEVRNTNYEKVSQNIQFPCKFKKYGCEFYDAFNKIRSHEDYCMFKTILCPAMSCNEIVSLQNIVKHVEQIHGQLIMKNPLSMKGGKTNYFILHSDKLFVFHTDFSEEKGTIALSSLNNTDDINDKIFTLITKGTNNNNLIQHDYSFNDYTSKIKSKDQMIPICVNTLKTILNAAVVQFDVKIVKETKMKQDDILKQLECPVCLSTMGIPIYQCTTGHSICANCKQRLYNCPSCQSYWSNARNFALEKIAETVSK